jgi:hypothetical protein
MQERWNRFSLWNVLLKSFQGFETIVSFLNLKSVNIEEVLEQVESKDCVQWKVDTVFSYSVCLWVSLLEKWNDVAYIVGKRNRELHAYFTLTMRSESWLWSSGI